MAENQNIDKSFKSEENNFASQFMAYFHLVWDNIWWYVLGCAVALLLALFYLYRTPNVYTRTSKVIVDDNAQETSMRDLTAFSGSAARRYAYGVGGVNVFNEMEIFASVDLMQTVVEKLGLETSYMERQFARNIDLYDASPVKMTIIDSPVKTSFSFKLRKTGPQSFELHSFFTAGEPLKDKPVKGNLGEEIETPVGKLVFSPTFYEDKWDNEITVTWCNAAAVAKGYAGALSAAVPNKQNSVLVLSIRGGSPRRLENVLKTLVDCYDELWLYNMNKSARKTTEFINDRLVVIEEELAQIEKGLQEFKSKNNLTDVKSEAQSVIGERTLYSQKYFDITNQLEIAKFIQEYLMDPSNVTSLIPANSGLSAPGIEAQIQEYNKAVLQRERLLASSSEKHPVVAELTSALESLRPSIQRSVANLITTLQMEVDLIEDEDQSLKGKISAASSHEIILLGIERQHKVKESLYVYLLQKREENEISSLATAANTRMVQQPTGPTGPSSPKRMVILVFALFAGFVVVFFAIYIKKTSDYKIHDKMDLAGVVTIPFLAEIPEVISTEKHFGANVRQAQKVENDRDAFLRQIFVKSGRRDIMNEAYRVLRTNVDMMAGGEKKVIMMTSFNPNAGKTLTIMNLAQSMAIKNSKVLIVDFDLRKATLSKALSSNSTGISAYLTGKVDNAADIITNVDSNLDLLPVGAVPPNPAELLLTPKCKELLDSLRDKYDYIFVDCPPIDIVADTAIVSKLVDMTIFVIRAGLMDRRLLPQVEEIYQSGLYKNMAIILNAVHFSSAKSKGYASYSYDIRSGRNKGGSAHYGYGYNYGYGYGYGDEKNGNDIVIEKGIFHFRKKKKSKSSSK